MKLLAFILCCVAFSGCTTALTTKSDALKYKNASITEFISDRYTSLVDYLPNFKTNNHQISAYTFRMFNNSSVLYPVAFYAGEQQYIYAPIFEFNALCEAQNGKLHLISSLPSYNLFMLRAVGHDLYVGLDYSETLQTIIQNTERIKPEIYARQNSYPILTLPSWNSIKRFKSKSLTDAYALAVTNNAFGVFRCVENGNNVLWGVAIQPNTYGIDGHFQNLYLLITGFKK